MKVLDFHRSFFFFEHDFDRKPPRTVSDSRQNRHNRARIRIDCRCLIRAPYRVVADYYLGEACAAERCGCARRLGLFIHPGAEFRAAYSGTDMVIFKKWAQTNAGVRLVPPSLGLQPERQVIETDQAFFRHELRVRQEEAVRLKNLRQIIAATDAGRPLVGRTEFRRGGFRVLLEYPIVTFNVSETYRFFQADTGPVLFPELTASTQRVGETLRLAFVAFNSPKWAEFLLQKPIAIGRGHSVTHYSASLQVNARNSIWVTA